MAYITVEDWLANRYLWTELVQLTDIDGIGRPSYPVFYEAEAQARGIVNGYLSAKYVTPLAVVPPQIQLIMLDLTRWILHKQGAPDDVILKKDDAFRMLKDYGKGLLPLDVTAIASPTFGFASTSPTIPVFTHDPGPVEIADEST